MDVSLLRKILLVDIGNITLAKGNAFVGDAHRSILLQDGLKYAIPDKDNFSFTIQYEAWIENLISKQAVNCFRLSFINPEYIDCDFYKSERGDVSDTLFVECVNERSSDFYTELTLPNVYSCRCIFPISTAVPTSYEVKGNLAPIKEQMREVLIKLCDFIAKYDVYYLKPFFDNVMQHLDDLHPDDIIPDNNFTIGQKQIVNAFLNSNGMRDIIMQNERVLNEDQEREMFRLYDIYYMHIEKAFLQCLNCM